MKVYLDYSATSFKKPNEVFKKIEEFYKSNNTSPGRGGYQLAIEAGKMVLSTRNQIKSLFNVGLKDHVIFTKNVTESLNIAIKGLVKKGDHVLITSIEHNSVYRVVEHLKEQGIIEYDIIQVNKDGTLPLDDFNKLFKVNTNLCIINHASNVSGHIMPVEEIGRICHRYNVKVIVDGAQSAGLLTIDFKELNCDVFCFTGHKYLMGPTGIGGFIVKDEISKKIETLIDGGTGSFSEESTMPTLLPDRFEAGTLNTIGIAGLNGALSYLLSKDTIDIILKEKELHDKLYEGIKDIPGINFYGDMLVFKLPVLSFNIKGLDSGELAGILDYQYGIMTRSGLHCSPLAHETFNSLNGSIRISIGHYTTNEEIEYVIEVLNKLGNYK